MSANENSEIRASLKEANQANLKWMSLVIVALWGITSSISLYVFKSWESRLSGAEQANHIQATDIALLKAATLAHENQLQSLAASANELRRSIQDLLLQMTATRESLATIKERVTYTGDRIESLAKYLRDNSQLDRSQGDSKRELLDTTPRRDRTERDDR